MNKGIKGVHNMSKKKLLSEAQVRRFMGLAGMKSNLVSNYLKEADLKEVQNNSKKTAAERKAEKERIKKSKAPIKFK